MNEDISKFFLNLNSIDVDTIFPVLWRVPKLNSTFEFATINELVLLKFCNLSSFKKLKN